MFILDGHPLNPDLPFEHDGIQYPANWLRLATPEERAAIGITEVPDYPRPDDRFYWVTQNPDGTYTATPKDIVSIKAMKEQEIKSTAYSLLSQTDYKFIRMAETGVPVDDATKAYRIAVRASIVANETSLNAATSVDEIAALKFEWPQS